LHLTDGTEKLADFVVKSVSIQYPVSLLFDKSQFLKELSIVSLEVLANISER